MQQHRYIQYLSSAFLQRAAILWMISTMLICTTLLAQDTARLADLYRSHQISELQRLNNGNGITDAGWRLFIAAIFETDAETGSQMMLQAYSKSNDAQLHQFIRNRVSQFYSARGYYDTSRRILEDEAFFQRIISVNSSSKIKNKNRSGEAAIQSIDEKGNHFGIQVGAFSTLENAENIRRKYQKTYADAKVMKKVRNGNSLFIVVVGKYSSREEAESAIPAINNKLSVKGYIIQF